MGEALKRLSKKVPDLDLEDLAFFSFFTMRSTGNSCVLAPSAAFGSTMDDGLDASSREEKLLLGSLLLL